MRDEKVCINKSVGIIAVVAIVLLALVIGMVSLSSVKTSTNTKAKERFTDTSGAERDYAHGWLIIDELTLNISGMTVYVKEKGNAYSRNQCHTYNFYEYSHNGKMCAGKTMTYFVKSKTETLYVNQKSKKSTAIISTKIPTGVETNVIISNDTDQIGHGNMASK